MGFQDDLLFTTYPSAPRSEIYVTSSNGYGSDSNNKVRRWTNTIKSTGSDITYSDASTTGSLFTINTTGLYAAGYVDQFNSGNNGHAITVNSASLSLSTLGTSFPDAQRLSNCMPTAADRPAQTSFVGILSAGDLIRPQTDGGVAGANTFLASFRIAKINN